MAPAPLTSANTAVVLDSTSDAPQLAERRNVRIVPLTVTFGDEDYRDHVDLDPAAFYAKLAASIIDNGMLNGETIRLDGAIRMAPR